MLTRAVAGATEKGNGTSLSMHEAVKSGLVESVSQMLHDGADVDTVDKHLRTALHVAVLDQEDRMNIVRMLIERGATINLQDGMGRTPLHHAVTWMKTELARYLLQHGADVRAVDAHCRTPLHLATDAEQARLLLEHGAGLNVEEIEGLRPLHTTILVRDAELVQVLLMNGADVNATDDDGNTPLFVAVEEGDSVVVRLLIEHNARINVRNIFGATSLHHAVRRQDFDIARVLLKHGADVTIFDEYRNTPLHYVASRKLGELLGNCDDPLRRRLESIYNIFDVSAAARVRLHSDEDSAASMLDQCTDKCGNTALHHIIYGSESLYSWHKRGLAIAEEVDFLLRCRGADINAQNKSGHTPLHVAHGDSFKICLQKANEQSFEVRDKRGRNFWHLLCQQLRLDKAPVALVTQLRSSAYRGVGDVDLFGRTPVHYAAIIGCNPSLVKFILNIVPESISTQDCYGRTPLHYAALSGQQARSYLFSCTNADASIRDIFGKTYSEYLRTKRGSTPIIRTLINNLDDFTSKLTACGLMRFEKDVLYEDIMKGLQDISASPKRNLEAILLDIYHACFYDQEKVILNTPGQNSESADDEKKTHKHLESLNVVIHEIVLRTMNYLAAEIEKLDRHLKCNIVLVGSAYEGTKVGICDEFDFMFVLTYFSNVADVLHSPESPPGFVQLKAKKEAATNGGYFTDDGIIDTRAVKFMFETAVMQVLSAPEFQTHTHMECVDLRENATVDIVRPRAVFAGYRKHNASRNNSNVKLKYMKPIDGHHLSRLLSVDLVPAIQIPGWWPDGTVPVCERLLNQCGCHFVFSQPQKLYPWIGWSRPYAFVSFALAESELLRASPLPVKAAYMVVKAIAHNFTELNFSTYRIKTAVLFLLAAEKDFSRLLATEVHGKELVLWVRSIIRRLLCFAVQDFVPSYFVPDCKLPTWMFEIFLKCAHVRLHRFGVNYGDFFAQTPCKMGLLQAPEIKEILKPFVSIHLLYWSLLPDDAERKLYLPNNNESICDKSSWPLFADECLR